MNLFKNLTNPDRVEICPICNKQRPMKADDVGSAVWYRPTWEGHADCYAEMMIRDQKIREEQLAEEARQKAEYKAECVREMIANGFGDSGISPERRSFAELKRYASNAKAYDAAVKWEFPAPGFALFGPPGTGKSHVLAAIAQTIPDKYNRRFSMVRWGRWVKETYAERDFSAKEIMCRWLREAPVLFVDDIGAEKLSEHAESLLDDIIHEREEFRRPTFMSTNLTPDGLEKILTPRLWSRIQSLMEFIPVGGKDIRKTKAVKKCQNP
jgi:DNA replication protein DnaC